MKNLTFRDFISLLFLLLGFMVLVVAWQSYRLKAATSFYQEIDFQREKNEKEHRRVIKEMKTLLSKAKVSAGRYDVVAEKNLFSVNRKAWLPPHKAGETAGENDKEAEIKKDKKKQDIILYGTMVSGKKKMALLEFKRFRRDKPKRLVSEGETVSSESGRSRYQYTLVTVEKTSVVVKEEQSGKSYTIPLFDAFKRRPAKTANKAISQTQDRATRLPKTLSRPADRKSSRRTPAVRRLPPRRLPTVKNNLESSLGSGSRNSGVSPTSANTDNGSEQGGRPPEMPKSPSNPSVRIRRYHPVIPEK